MPSTVCERCGKVGECLLCHDCDDAMKTEFTLCALGGVDPFANKVRVVQFILPQPLPFLWQVAVPIDVREAIRWQSTHSADEIIAFREEFVSCLEQRHQHMVECGVPAEWRLDGDPLVADVARDVNGPLLLCVARAANHQDTACVELFRQGSINFTHLSMHGHALSGRGLSGAPLYGLLDEGGIGDPVDFDMPETVDMLRDDCLRSNLSLLPSLKEDAHASELFRWTSHAPVCLCFPSCGTPAG